MAIDAHIHKLEKRHRELDSQLAQVLMHPSVDDVEIAALKRQKLFVKDKIEKLRHEVMTSH